MNIYKKDFPKNVPPTEPYKKISLIFYNFKTSKLIISNNSYSFTDLDWTNVVYMFKCPLGYGGSNGNNSV